MADVKVPEHDWGKLKASALFFVPALCGYDARGLVNRKEMSTTADSLAKSAMDKNRELSPAAMTNLLGLRPMGHKKCESAVQCFNLIAERDGRPERLDETQIVGAVFYSAQLVSKMSGAGLAAEDLANGPGAHFEDSAIIEEMVAGKRVTFAVGLRIARLLAAKDVPVHLREFLSTRHDRGERSVVMEKGEKKRSLLTGSDLTPVHDIAPAWADWSEPLNLPLRLPA